MGSRSSGQPCEYSGVHLNAHGRKIALLIAESMDARLKRERKKGAFPSPTSSMSVAALCRGFIAYLNN